MLSRLSEAAVAVVRRRLAAGLVEPQLAALLGDPASVPVSVRNFARGVFPLDRRPRGRAVAGRRPRPGPHRGRGGLRPASRHRTLPRRPPIRRPGPQPAGWECPLRGAVAEGTVSAHREDLKVVHHPTVGPVAINCDTLTDGEADLKIVVMTPARNRGRRPFSASAAGRCPGRPSGPQAWVRKSPRSPTRPPSQPPQTSGLTHPVTEHASQRVVAADSHHPAVPHQTAPARHRRPGTRRRRPAARRERRRAGARRPPRR